MKKRKNLGKKLVTMLVSVGFFAVLITVFNLMALQAIREKNNVLNFDPQKGIPQREDYRRTDEINKELKETNQRIRDYLASLDVAE